MHNLVKWLIGFVVVIVIILLLSGMYFFHVAQVRNPKSNQPDILRSKDNSLYRYENTFLARHKQIWHETTRDGLKLDAWYVPADKKTNKTAILAHGWHNNKTTMAIYGELFHELGYNVLIPDNRAHGDSQGKIIGYGWLDRRDYIQWLNQIIKYQGQDTDIIMYGMSMGAATVLQVSGEPDLPHQVKAVIADSAYTNLADETKYQAKAMYHLPSFPFVNVVSGISKIRAGYFYGEVSPLKQASKSSLPTFFIHGSADDFVPTKMVYPLYRALKAPKLLWVSQGSKHVQSFHDHPVLYRDKIEKFLSEYDR